MEKKTWLGPTSVLVWLRCGSFEWTGASGLTKGHPRFDIKVPYRIVFAKNAGAQAAQCLRYSLDGIEEELTLTVG
jgi:hypothetical protein